MHQDKFRFASMSRRAAITGAALATMALAACSGGGGKAAEGDMGKGAPEGAKVTVVEYASVTCGACAAWQETVWPQVKAKYVDTNQVRFVFREFPTPPQDIAVAGFLLARCAGDDKYFQVVEAIMASQKEWQAGVSPRDSLQRIAAGAGVSPERFQQCVTDEAAIKAMEERIRTAQSAGIAGTPTFEVNGKRVADSSFAGLSAAIDDELAKS